MAKMAMSLAALDELGRQGMEPVQDEQVHHVDHPKRFEMDGHELHCSMHLPRCVACMVQRLFINTHKACREQHHSSLFLPLPLPHVWGKGWFVCAKVSCAGASAAEIAWEWDDGLQTTQTVLDAQGVIIAGISVAC